MVAPPPLAILMMRPQRRAIIAGKTRWAHRIGPDAGEGREATDRQVERDRLTDQPALQPPFHRDSSGRSDADAKPLAQPRLLSCPGAMCHPRDCRRHRNYVAGTHDARARVCREASRMASTPGMV